MINRRILSKPIFESYYTDEMYGESLGLNGWESIQRLDVLPEDVAGQMADSAARNKLIVQTYKASQKIQMEIIPVLVVEQKAKTVFSFR